MDEWMDEDTTKLNEGVSLKAAAVNDLEGSCDLHPLSKINPRKLLLQSQPRMFLF